MPADFDLCRKEGGRIKTKKLGGGKYMHICWDKNGKSHAGEVKTAQATSKTAAKATTGSFIRAAEKMAK